MDEEIKRILEDHEKRLKKLEGKLLPVDQQESPENTSNGLQKNIETFCNDLEIKEEKLREKIDFHEKMPRLMIIPKEDTRKKLQFKSLLILGWLWIKIYEKDLNENVLRELFKLSRVSTQRLDNFYSAKYFRKYFTKQKTKIEFSWAGEKEAKKEIINLVKNDK